MDFTSRLSELRHAYGVSILQLANDVGVSLRALQYYASGAREPSMTTLIALADYFDVSIDYLVGRVDKR